MEIQLLVKKGRTTTSALPIRRFPTVIGRHRDCNLRIAARQVSRRHCVLKDRDGWLVICDLGSCNGTLVNGRHLRGDLVLHPGDLLEVGPVMFEIQYSSPADVSNISAADTVTSMQTVTETSVEGNAYELSERLNELDRRHGLDSLDTHRPGDAFLSAHDSDSKIVILSGQDDAAASPTRRIFSSEIID